MSESGDDMHSHMMAEKSLPNLQPEAALFHDYTLDYAVQRMVRITSEEGHYWSHSSELK